MTRKIYNYTIPVKDGYYLETVYGGSWFLFNASRVCIAQTEHGMCNDDAITWAMPFIERKKKPWYEQND